MNTFIMGRDLLDIETLMILKATGSKKVEATATGNPLTFLTDIARPLKSLLIPFTPKQTGSGDPSPDNVRPITGWTGVTVNHAGKNLFLCFDDITFGKWINGSGVESNNSRGCITNEIQGEAGITYTFSFNGVSPLDFCVIELNASKTFIKRNRGTTDDQQTEITFTTDANTTPCGTFSAEYAGTFPLPSELRYLSPFIYWNIKSDHNPAMKHQIRIFSLDSISILINKSLLSI